MSPDKTSNWYQDEEGWHKTDDPGGASNGLTNNVFNQPIPPVRDAETGHPIGPGGDIDWARVIRDANERQG
jgi:hypothetical protein